ncbi:hypothetical protein [Psychroserpens algicola]|uniref:Uncharacterized protein n=1 Tax=Psychroserpens algicola TaxID=1719034 RepID=A0ABT0H3P0_9FLAO|nr:hypothetical protein [Psychroserpens algicola]MCK8479001.1 hypothetical protein [Psychroserpens algicola]
MITYPAKIHRYTIQTSPSKTAIRLYGFETSHKDDDENQSQSIIADFQFSSKPMEKHKPAFINRGGFINVTYPLSMLPSILTLLHLSDVLIINADGELTNHNI